MQQGITQTGNFEVAKIDKLRLNMELKQFKESNGSVNFLAIKQIPAEERIYELAKRDLEGTIKIIAVALTLAFESMNLTRPMNAFQILDLSEVILEESESDKLSIPDLLIFLQKLTRGHYPGLYEGMDAVKFLERFNQYRDERWQEFIRIRDEQNEYYKSLGDTNLYERENPRDASTLGLQLQHYKEKLQAKSDERRERRNYNQ